MRIRTVTASNYKNLNLDHTPLAFSTLVMGKNGQGKTNLLKLLETCFMEKQGGNKKQEFLEFEGSLEETGFIRFGEDEATVRLHLEGSGPKHEKLVNDLSIDYLHGNQERIIIEFSIKESKTSSQWEVTLLRLSNVEFLGEGADKKLTSDQHELFRKYLNDAWKNSVTYIPLNRFGKGSISRLDLSAPIDPAADLPNALHAVITDEGEADFDTMGKVKELLKSLYQIVDIRSAIKTNRVKPKFGNPSENGAGQAQLSVQVKEKEDGPWIRIDRVGAGIHQMVVMAIMIFRSKASIVLAEEFETSLSLPVRTQVWAEFHQLVEDGFLEQFVGSSHTIWRPAIQKGDPGEDGNPSFSVFTLGPATYDEMDQVNFRQWQRNDFKQHGHDFMKEME
jgi:hypothetical protein